jgi:hypothetical protein
MRADEFAVTIQGLFRLLNIVALSGAKTLRTGIDRAISQ